MTFKCKRCGACCGIIPFDKFEKNLAQTSADKLGVEFEQADIMGIPGMFYCKKTLAAFKNKDLEKCQCEFLMKNADGTTGCAIYKNRPHICRIFGKGGHPMLTCPHKED